MVQNESENYAAGWQVITFDVIPCCKHHSVVPRSLYVVPRVPPLILSMPCARQTQETQTCGGANSWIGGCHKINQKTVRQVSKLQQSILFHAANVIHLIQYACALCRACLLSFYQCRVRVRLRHAVGQTLGSEDATK